MNMCPEGAEFSFPTAAELRAGPDAPNAESGVLEITRQLLFMHIFLIHSEYSFKKWFWYGPVTQDGLNLE